MGKVQWRVPDLTGDNVTPNFIVEELGKIKAVKSILKKAEEFYKEAWKARRGDLTTMESENFVANLTMVPRLALNQEKAKEILTSIGRLEECMDGKDVETLYVQTKAFGSNVTWKDVLKAVRDVLPEEVTLEFEIEEYQG